MLLLRRSFCVIALSIFLYPSTLKARSCQGKKGKLSRKRDRWTKDGFLLTGEGYKNLPAAVTYIHICREATINTNGNMLIENLN